MILTDLNIGHMLGVTLDLREDEWDQIQLCAGHKDLDSVIAFGYNVPGPKWAAVEDDKAVIVGGFIPQRAGVYATWFLVTQHGWKHHAREVTQIAIERKETMFREHGAHRLETVCLASRKLAHRWYKTIGSPYECTLKGFCTDGSDAMVFADVRGKS